MMFTIKQKNINDKLQTLSAVVDSSNSPDPVDRILDCAYFEVSARSMKITTSSADMQVSTIIEGEFSSKPLQFSVHAKNLAGIIHSLPSLLDIEFNVDESTVNIKSGKSLFSLPNFINTPYPILNIKKQEVLFDISNKQLKQALGSVSFSMGTHHLRYSLAGCMIRAQGGKIVFVSTDTHRLAHYQIVDEKTKDINKSMILPKKALMFIDKVLPNNDDKISVNYGGGDFMLIKSGEYDINAKLIVGAYPEFDRVFSQEMTDHVLADTKLLQESLQRASIFAIDKFRTVRFNIEKNKLIIESKSMVNETAKTEMDVNYEGEEVSFNFNAGYFTDLFSHFDDKITKLSFIDGNSSVIISFEGNSHYKYVLMPLRV